MTRKQDLEALHDDVAAGIEPNQDKFRKVLGWHADQRHQRAVLAFGGSIDAAKALHEAVLPGWHWNVSKDGVARVVVPSILRPIPIVGNSANPARAWLLAILAALIKMEKTQ